MAKPSPQFKGLKELKALGDAIRDRRLLLGISQEGLAHEAEVDRSYLGGIERGEHNLAFVNLLKISRALGANPSELLIEAQL